MLQWYVQMSAYPLTTWGRIDVMWMACACTAGYTNPCNKNYWIFLEKSMKFLHKSKRQYIICDTIPYIVSRFHLFAVEAKFFFLGLWEKTILCLCTEKILTACWWEHWLSELHPTVSRHCLYQTKNFLKVIWHWQHFNLM